MEREVRIGMIETATLFSDIVSTFDNKYNKNEKGCYINKNGIPFVVDYIKKWEAIVIEYQNNLEDGDIFFFSNYNTIDDLVNDVCIEIEAAA